MAGGAFMERHPVLRIPLLFVTGDAGAVHGVSIADGPGHRKGTIHSLGRALGGRHVFFVAIETCLRGVCRFGLIGGVTHRAGSILRDHPI